MKLNEYQRLASRTINGALTDKQKIAHALHGMWSEYGEIRGLFQKVYQGHKMDKEHLKKEIGDLFWFLCEIATALGIEIKEGIELGKWFFSERTEGYMLSLAYDMYQLELVLINEDEAITELIYAIDCLVCVCLSLDIDYEEALQMNIDKLKVRYPEGFDTNKSLHRAEGDI